MADSPVARNYNAAVNFVDRHVAEMHADRIAIRCENRAYSYGEIAGLMNRTGNALRDLGVEMESRVFLLLHDSPQFVAAFFGAIKIGAVPVPVNTMLRCEDYEHLLNDTRARVLITHEALWREIEQIRGRLHYLRHVVVVGRAKRDELEFGSWVAAGSPQLAPAQTYADDAAFWLYSSGSTGFPKAAVHLHHDMGYATEHYARQVLKLNETDITFSAAKLFFAYGLGNGLYFPFGAGACSILYPERPRPESVFDIIHRERPTVFYGVPTLYASMLAVPDAEKTYDLSSLRVCVSAGEALPAELFNRWRHRFGTEILDGIGSTEILHIFISNRPGAVKPGSTGIPVPGYEAKLVDEQGATVSKGEIGNLMIKGDSICSCYWNQHDRTKQTIRGEWIVTGDKYCQDEDGYFWHCGRSDDMLKVGGMWVSPVEVESTLFQHAAVLEAAVVGEKDQDGMIKPKAYVVLRHGYVGDEFMERELKTFVRDKIAPYKHPRWISFVSELPKTATGKTQRFKLRNATSAIGASEH
jgi:benzoate-CoA ligase family protein